MNKKKDLSNQILIIINDLKKMNIKPNFKENISSVENL